MRISHVCGGVFNRPLSRGGHFESQGNKKLCFCTSSLALNERLAVQNLLFEHCVIKVYWSSTCRFKCFAFVDYRIKSFIRYIHSMPSKKKRKSPCPFASAKKPSKQRKLSNFNKDGADVLAASDRGSYFEQEKLIALDKEEQSRWENKTVSASRSKIEDKGKDEPAEPGSKESWPKKLAGRGNHLQENLVKSLSCRFCHTDVTLLENVSARSSLGSPGPWFILDRVLSKRALPVEEYKRCLQYVRSDNFLIFTRTSPWVLSPLFTRTLFT